MTTAICSLCDTAIPDDLQIAHTRSHERLDGTTPGWTPISPPDYLTPDVPWATAIWVWAIFILLGALSGLTFLALT